MKRRKPNQKRAKAVFKATANNHHPKNAVPTPMRGGYRL